MSNDPYEETIHDIGNRRMRAASGRVNDHSPLVAFLYELARDHVTTGVLEERIDRLSQNYDPLGPGFMFTNGYLARWAQDAAKRLTNMIDWQWSSELPDDDTTR